jgi:hypothetical protein
VVVVVLVIVVMLVTVVKVVVAVVDKEPGPTLLLWVIRTVSHPVKMVKRLEVGVVTMAVMVVNTLAVVVVADNITILLEVVSVVRVLL